MATAYQPTGTEKFNTYIVDYITYHRKPSDHIYIQPVIRRVFGTTGSVKSGLSKADYLGEISFLSRERREERGESDKQTGGPVSVLGLFVS